MWRPSSESAEHRNAAAIVAQVPYPAWRPSSETAEHRNPKELIINDSSSGVAAVLRDGRASHTVPGGKVVLTSLWRPSSETAEHRNPK